MAKLPQLLRFSPLLDLTHVIPEYYLGVPVGGKLDTKSLLSSIPHSPTM